MLQNVKKALANSEPSTHGTSLHFAACRASLVSGPYAAKVLWARADRRRDPTPIYTSTRQARFGYSADWMAWSSRKRIAPSLLRSEITKRTRPWLEVSA